MFESVSVNKLERNSTCCTHTHSNTYGGNYMQLSLDVFPKIIFYILAKLFLKAAFELECRCRDIRNTSLNRLKQPLYSKLSTHLTSPFASLTKVADNADNRGNANDCNYRQNSECNHQQVATCN